METNKKNINPETPQENLEWGDHNPKLTDHNFIDKKPKKISDQNELLAGSNAPIVKEEHEPGRNRKGVKEGENPLDLDTKRGKVF
jgi:hypothetical protein